MVIHVYFTCMCTYAHMYIYALSPWPCSCYTVPSLHVCSSICAYHMHVLRVPMHMYIYALPPWSCFSYTVPSLHVWSSICITCTCTYAQVHVHRLLGRTLHTDTPCLHCTCGHPYAYHMHVYLCTCTYMHVPWPCSSYTMPSLHVCSPLCITCTPVPMHMYLYAPPPRPYSSYAVLSLHVCITCMCTYPHVHRHRLLGHTLLMTCLLCTCGHPYASHAHTCVHTCIRAMCLSAP